MILFNQEIGDKDCEFNTDANTKNFLVSFFGFYPHHIAEDLNKFIAELGIKDIIDNVNKSTNTFKLDGDFGIEGYNVCDRRTFDVAIVVPKVFSTKKEALDWFNSKIKDSDFIKRSEINELDVLDGDKLITFLNAELEYGKKVKIIDIEFKNNLEAMKKTMLEQFSHDKDYKQIINQKFS